MNEKIRKDIESTLTGLIADLKPAPAEPVESKLTEAVCFDYTEKDNTRFIRTDFPSTQKKRSGLCGGPLLNAQGQAIGIHCGSTWEDKSYAASVRIIPYLLQAYYEGNAQIPVIAKGINFGSIDLNERIIYIENLDEQGHVLNQEDIYEQLPQSLMMALYQDPEVRYLRFILVSHRNDYPTYRVLIYDKKTGTHSFKPLHRGLFN